MESKIPISVVILTKNSERYLSKVLDPLIVFDEVLIIDNGSIDNTLKIASTYRNVKIYEEEFIGFGPPRFNNNLVHESVILKKEYKIDKNKRRNKSL